MEELDVDDDHDGYSDASDSSGELLDPTLEAERRITQHPKLGR
jgi:hypothetical protein